MRCVVGHTRLRAGEPAGRTHRHRRRQRLFDRDQHRATVFASLGRPAQPAASGRQTGRAVGGHGRAGPGQPRQRRRDHQTPATALGLIALVTFVLLFLLTGSVVQALVCNMLSLTAAFGAMVWIFQDGHLRALGTTPNGTLNANIPMLLFCIAFGLAMDYEVFLVARIREYWLASQTTLQAPASAAEARAANDESTALGLAGNGRVVTAAALVMSISFAALIPAQLSFMRMLGLGLTLAVLSDATLVRPTRPSLQPTRIIESAAQHGPASAWCGWCRLPMCSPVLTRVAAGRLCRTVLRSRAGFRAVEPGYQRQCHSRGEFERGLLVRVQCGEQFVQPLSHTLSTLPDNFAAGRGDDYDGHAPIGGVNLAAHHAFPLEALDELSHRRLAQPDRPSQHAESRGPLGVETMQHIRGGQAQFTAIVKLSNDQQRGLFQGHRDGIGTAIQRLQLHNIAS